MNIINTGVTNNPDGDFIKWDPKLKIGIPQIDQQHETLVNMCNDFYQSLLQNNNSDDYKEIVRETLEKCMNYAATHFKDEEKFMLASNFPGYKAHKISHDSFVEQVELTYNDLEHLPIGEAIKFAHFLYNWIQNHIAYEDRLYLPNLMEFLKSKASK